MNIAMPKAITHYMLGGEQHGCIKCTRKVWTAVVYKIPHVVVSKCQNIEGLMGGGIYFLIGEGDDGHQTIYVGKASVRVSGKGMTQRIQETHSTTTKKSYRIDDWEYAVALTTKNDELGATELAYLEYEFYRMAEEANRCVVLNMITPPKGTVSEESRADIDEYIQHAKILMLSLGLDVFTPVKDKSQNNSSPVLYLKHPDCDGRGRYTEDGFIVLNGSRLRSCVPESCPDAALRARKLYEDKIKDGVLQEDIIFRTPSGAASFVGGGSINGWEKWQTDDGKSLKDIMPK